MTNTIYQLVVHYLDDDSGRWASKHIAHSLSIDTLKAKTVERKDIFDEVWILNEQQNWQLQVGSDYESEWFIISPIILL